MVFFFKQKTAYGMRISDWSSDVCSSDLKTRTTDLFFPGNDVSGHQYQPIPDFGINLHLTDRVTLAVTSFGGGLGQSYDKPFVPDHGFSKERANFIQAGIAPTVAYKVRDNLSVGAGIGQIGRAHVYTPVTHAHIVCR